MSGQIAEFWASLGFKISPDEIKKVDNFLGDTEKKLRKSVGATKDQTKAQKEQTKAVAATGKVKEKEAKSAEKAAKATATQQKETQKLYTVTEKMRKSREKLLAQERREASRVAKTTREMQGRMNALFPSMVTSPLGAKSGDRRQLSSFYRGAFDRAEAGKFDIRRTLPIAESTALRHIGKNSPMFSPLGGRVNEYFRKKAVSPEVSALGRIGVNNPKFAALGTAFSKYDDRLSSLQMQGRADQERRSRAANLGRIDERLSYLKPAKSPEMRSMADFYKRQERAARVEERARERGLRDEERIAELRRRAAMIESRAQRTKQALTNAMPTGNLNVLGTATSRSPSSIGRGNYLHAGGATGAFMRYGAASLPFIGGMYGVGALNRANQNLMSTEIASSSIFGDRAAESKQWLDRHSDYVGYSYMDAMPLFTSFMASGMPLMGYDTSRGVFESLTEFGRTRGADALSMKRAMTAVQQMAAKGQIMQEELKLQLSEAKGFGETRQIFAEAWQIASGGNLTGDAAAGQLINDMQAGKVKSADVLPIVAMLMKELASGGIEKARTSSIAEQARASNAATRALRVASESGLEGGFSNLWRGLTRSLGGAEPLVRGLSGAFLDLSKVVRPFAVVFENLNRAFETFSDMVGVSEKNLLLLAAAGPLLMSKWGRVGFVFSAIAIVLEDIMWGVQGINKSITGDFFNWLDRNGVKLGTFAKAVFGMSAALLTMATALKFLKLTGSIGDVFKDVPKGPRTLKHTPLGTRLSRAGGLALLGSFAYSGYQTSQRSTQDIRDQYGITFGQGTLWGDAGARILGGMADYGNMLTFGKASEWGSDLGLWLADQRESALARREALKTSATDMFDSVVTSITETFTRIGETIQGHIRGVHGFFYDLVPPWIRGKLGIEDPRTRQDEAAAATRTAREVGVGWAGRPQISGVNLDMKVTIDAANPEDFNEKFKQQFSDVIVTTINKYTRGE